MNFKLFYLFYYMTFAAFDYINIYFSEIGFSLHEISIINSIPKTIAFLILPLWGITSDYFKANKKLLQLAVAGSLLLSLIFLQSTNMQWIIVMMIVFSIFQNPVIPLSNSLLLGYLEEKGNEYGKYRLWGSVGYGLMVSFFGLILEKTTLANLFYLYALVAGIALIISYKLPEEKVEIKVGSFKEFRFIFKNKELMYLLIYTFVIQLTLAANTAFFPIYLVSNGGKEFLFGLVMTAASVSSIIVYKYSERILIKYSQKKIVLFSTLFFTLRWVLLAFFPTAVIYIIANILHGISFVTFYISAINFINLIMRREFRATGQNLFSAVQVGVAPIIGILLGGYLFGKFGGEGMYIILSLITLVGGFAYFLLLSKRKGSMEAGKNLKFNL